MAMPAIGQLIPPAVIPHIKRFGISGVIAVGIVVVMLLGINPVSLLTGETSDPPALTSITGVPAEGADREALAGYARIINAESDVYWKRTFRQASVAYAPPKFIVANSSNEFGCGMAGHAIGTFYCRRERAVYVDLAAYDQLRQEYGQAAHYAQAVMIAYAFGNHVQYLVDHFVGDTDPLRPLGSATEQQLRGERLGMQAYCYAAQWVKVAGLPQLFEDPDVVRAFDAAIAMPAEARAAAMAEGIYKALPPPSIADRNEWFAQGYDIPAAGTCKMSKIAEDG
jgi:predicted metalloprotease